MKEDEWRQKGLPYHVYPNGKPSKDELFPEDSGYRICECSRCNEVIGFEQYPPDGEILCIECGMKAL